MVVIALRQIHDHYCVLPKVRDSRISFEQPKEQDIVQNKRPEIPKNGTNLITKKCTP